MVKCLSVYCIAMDSVLMHLKGKQAFGRNGPPANHPIRRPVYWANNRWGACMLPIEKSQYIAFYNNNKYSRNCVYYS